LKKFETTVNVIASSAAIAIISGPQLGLPATYK